MSGVKGAALIGEPCLVVALSTIMLADSNRTVEECQVESEYSMV